MDKIYPETIDPSLPENIISAHAKIAADLAKVQLDYAKTVNERNRLRSDLANSFDLGAMEQVRKLAGKANSLLQLELNVRQELKQWFPGYHKALQDAHEQATEAVKAHEKKVRDQLATIGFREEDVPLGNGLKDRAGYLYKEFIATHPEILAMGQRVRTLGIALDGMTNPQQEGSPVRLNVLAVEKIAAKIKEAITRQEQLLALL